VTPKLWSSWLALYSSLLDKGFPVSAPFLPLVPSEFKKQSKTVLYIGKATNGACDRTAFDSALATSSDLARNQSESFSRAVFEGKVGRRGASFWGFANDLAEALNPKIENLGNLSWSNICKIGSDKGNPKDCMLTDQIPLAVRTLRHEIALLKPTIIVCVANSYANPVLIPALGNPSNSAWEKSEARPEIGVDNVWWLRRTQSTPAVLWMRHPQGSKDSLRQFVLMKAAELTAS